MAKKREGDNLPDAASSSETLSVERREIAAWLKKVRFRRRLFGGVDERNVWKRLAELDALYTRALEAERIRYDALLEDYIKSANRRIRELQSRPPGEGGDSSG